MMADGLTSHDEYGLLDERPAREAVAPSSQPRRGEERSLGRVERCGACGYDLRGIASERCPECGATESEASDVLVESDRWSDTTWAMGLFPIVSFAPVAVWSAFVLVCGFAFRALTGPWLADVVAGALLFIEWVLAGVATIWAAKQVNDRSIGVDAFFCALCAALVAATLNLGAAWWLTSLLF